MDISCQGTDYDISQLLHRAKSLLVLRRFDDVLEVCTGAFELVSKRRDDSHLSNDLFRNSDQWTHFAVIGIQAFAEINQCQKAITFTTKAFEHFRKFPTEALELCVCLLLKASKYKEAGKLVQDWLSCEDNFSQVKYVKIAEVYVKHILFPQQLHEEIKCFLETNQVIPSSEKQVLFQFTKPFADEKVERCNTSHELTAPAQLPAEHSVANRWLRVRAVVQKLQSLYRIVLFHQKTRILE
ncbi:peroxisome assembly protein 26 isoform X2 [Pocillopora verrucosa]|uniref:peroxisome assembly protein 26 isoform X2 n=1 Tax=Pocillopora verrucosa TaxID=203993 RepID=UPI0033418AB8